MAVTDVVIQQSQTEWPLRGQSNNPKRVTTPICKCHMATHFKYSSSH